VSWFFTKGVPKVDFSKCEFVGEFEDFHFMTPDIPTAFRRVSESCFNQYRQGFCRLLPYAYETHFAKTAPQGSLHWRTILNDSHL